MLSADISCEKTFYDCILEVSSAGARFSLSFSVNMKISHAITPKITQLNTQDISCRCTTSFMYALTTYYFSLCFSGRTFCEEEARRTLSHHAHVRKLKHI